MAKNEQFKSALKRFRRDLEQVINEKALTLGQEISKKTAYAFQSLARERLLRDPQTAPEASHLVQQVADNIQVVETTRKITTTHTDYSPRRLKGKKSGDYSGYAVKVKIDKQGLAMFLEYGTGLEGQANNHPEASKFGWEYAINNNKTKEIQDNYHHRVIATKWYPTLFSKKGFIFRDRKNSYITNSDIKFKNGADGIEPMKYISVAPTPMHSKSGKPFIRPAYTYFRRGRIENNYTKNDYIISSGIKPIRYIYDTKKTLRGVLQSSKNASEVMDKLDKLQGVTNG